MTTHNNLRLTLLLVVFSGLLLYRCVDSARSSESASSTENRTGPRRAEVLFLGHTSEHHDSEKYAPWLAISAFAEGINLTYTTDLNDLNPANLSKYDGLVVYANYDTLSSSQESAMKDFVEGGKGLIPLHCASGCFKNSDWYINAIGGQFASHETGTFASAIVKPEHPVMQGLNEFETWDETYVHQNINPDMTVLMERVEGDHHEPYTWVRNQGKTRFISEDQKKRERDWCVENLRRVSKIAADCGVAIGLEPLNRFESDMVNTMDQALSLVDEVAHPSLKLLLDTFHANIEEKSIPATIRKIGKERLCHIQGNESDRGTPGTGNLDWVGIKEALTDIEYEGAIVIETFGAVSEEIAKATCIWRPLANSSDELAREGLHFYKTLFALSNTPPSP